MKPTWTPTLQFSKVDWTYPPWPKHWLRESRPGTLLVYDPITAKHKGGLLKLTREGLFVSVNERQLYNGEIINWPGRDPQYEGIRIIGPKIEVVELKKNSG